MNVSTMLWEAAGIFILIQTALGWVGWAFGKSKGRAVAGFVLGFLFGTNRPHSHYSVAASTRLPAGQVASNLPHVL